MWECMVKGHAWVVDRLMSTSMVTYYRCTRCGKHTTHLHQRL